MASPSPLPAPDRAHATLYVAMAGRPVPGPEALVGLRSDVYRFDFELQREPEGWRVTRAAWHPARIGDLRDPARN